MVCNADEKTVGLALYRHGGHIAQFCQNGNARRADFPRIPVNGFSGYQVLLPVAVPIVEAAAVVLVVHGRPIGIQADKIRVHGSFVGADVPPEADCEPGLSPGVAIEGGTHQVDQAIVVEVSGNRRSRLHSLQRVQAVRPVIPE
ncbi:MAG TPA: hypothetical protein PLC40_18325, partial [Candidatus Hydrogenedentes bacterium]|nr:hypothetical protein [Candidatus Hydrogenedentota bacterium]